MDADLRSIQQARDLLRAAAAAQHRYKAFDQGATDRVVEAMCAAGEAEAERLGRLAFEETGFGRPESKARKNRFATKTLGERMRGMKTAGIVRKSEDGAVWEVATPMGVVAALVPSTNPTSTAMYKAIIAAKARCGLVMSPHPRAVRCTAEALGVVAEAAYRAGAPEGLFGCLTEVTLPATDALLEDEHADVILAAGGGAMVRAAYSKGKPAYGVGSGNVPVWVDRSADVPKAAADILTGVSFDWGTLCSTERSVVADTPIRGRLVEEMRKRGAHFCSPEEAEKLRRVVKKGGGLNVEIVGQSPQRIAAMAGFAVPEQAQALVAEVDRVGGDEPLSMETLSPILSFYTADGWEAGCARCIEVLEYGGIGHTLALHAQSERVVEQFALKKPSMRIVVNTVAALGSVGMTTALFPAMTLGPGTLGGSIVSDNVSPLHLLNVKRVAFETAPVGKEQGAETYSPRTTDHPPRTTSGGGWMDVVEARLRERAGNPSVPQRGASSEGRKAPAPEGGGPVPSGPKPTALALPEAEIDALIRRFRKG
jgi:acetaldehyde dehydrogenase (acetylating)